LSSFWRELFRLSGTHLRMSIAYHPQTDGQTEVMNRILEQYLRSFVHSQPANWFRYLTLAEWSYNTSLHSGSGFTPFEIIYSKLLLAIPQYLQGTSTNEDVDSLISSHQAIQEALQRRLSKAQAAMKKQADTKREDVTFNVGQWVYVKLCPFRQHSVGELVHPKLSKRFFGPFQVIDCEGQVAYHLRLPDNARIHPIFHCSLLHAHHGPLLSPSDAWPLQIIKQKPVPRPLCFLDSKLNNYMSPPTCLVLTQWLGQPPEDTTWEPWQELRDTYYLEDKVVFEDWRYC